MKWLKVLSVACLFAVIGFGGFQAYSMGYSGGETTGYAGGYSVGHEAGYSSGEQDGYAIGKTDGYNVGAVAGYDLGKQDGYVSGKGDGYEEGYSDGEEAVLSSGHTLRDPTYDQAITFLRQDKTDENAYVPTYVCKHFAMDVNNNARASGYRCAFVIIAEEGNDHTIIAFDTTDKGLVYFEPQSDDIVRPVIGKRFYQCVESSSGYYLPPYYDDTITEVLVIW